MSVFTKNRIGRLVYFGWMLPIFVISGFITAISLEYRSHYQSEVHGMQYYLAGAEQRTAESGFGELVGGTPRWYLKTFYAITCLTQKIVETNERDSSDLQDLRMKTQVFSAKFGDTILSTPEAEWTAPAVMAIIGENIPNMVLIGVILIIRRLHDLNKSGWLWLLGLIPLVNLIFGIYLLFGKGTEGANDFGDPPKKFLKKIQIGSPSIISRSDDDAFYQLAYEELENRQMDKALWAKILAQSGGNENKARSLYIKNRVKILKAVGES